MTQHNETYENFKINQNKKQHERCTIKCRLKDIYDPLPSQTHNVENDILYKTVKNVNDIIEMTGYFIKGFILYTLNNEPYSFKINTKIRDIFPKEFIFLDNIPLKYSYTLNDININEDFINIAMSIVSTKENAGGGRPFNESKQNLINILESYFEVFTKTTGLSKIPTNCTSYILHQEAGKIYTSIINNITLHFEKYIWKYIKNKFMIDHDIDKDTVSKIELKEYYSEILKIKTDIFDMPLKKTSNVEHKDWINENIKFILPNTYSPDKFNSDVIINTSSYIKCMHHMNSFFYDNNIKTYNIVPIKHKTYNNYIKLNTASIIDLFYGYKFSFENCTKIDVFTKSGSRLIQKYIWETVFKLRNFKNNPIFKRKDYSFNYEIETDGYGVSLNFIRNDKINDKDVKKNNFDKGRKVVNKMKMKIKRDLFYGIAKDIEIKLKNSLNIDTNTNINDNYELQQQIIVDFKNYLRINKKIIKDKIKQKYDRKLKEKEIMKKNKDDDIKKANKETQNIRKKEYTDKVKKEKESGTYNTNKEKEKIDKNNSIEFPYIEYLLLDESKRKYFKSQLEKEKLIVCDPGKRSILYMASCTEKPYTDEDKKIKSKERSENRKLEKLKKHNPDTYTDNILREPKIPNNINYMNNFGVTEWKHHKILNYTSDTRNHFIKRNHTIKLVNKWKNSLDKKTIPETVSSKELLWYSKTLKKIEGEMSFFNSKSRVHDEFMEYVIKRTEYLKKIELQYNTIRLQQLKWYAYLNKIRHENELLKCIKNVFGTNITIVIGDWSNNGRIKYRPTPNLSLKRKIVQEFETLSIDEYNTSILYNGDPTIKCGNLSLPIKTFTNTNKNKVNISVPKEKSIIKLNKNTTIIKEGRIKKKKESKSINKPNTIDEHINNKLSPKPVSELNNITSINTKVEYVTNISIIPLKIINPLINNLMNKKSQLKEQIRIKQMHPVLTYKHVKIDMVCKGSVFGCINRDKNSVLNMESILKHLINYGTKPDPFKRSNRVNVPNVNLTYQDVNLSDASNNIIITESRRECSKSSTLIKTIK